MITLYRHAMNKTQLVDALAARIGDRRTAATLVDGLIETIVDTVRAGGAVSLSGFGVFESRARAARVARNPRTGETVQVPATTVPAFRAGLAFRTAVGGGAQPVSRNTATRRGRSAPSAATAPAASDAAVETAAVADAPARAARGRSKAAPAEVAPVEAAPKTARKATGRKASMSNTVPAEEPVGTKAAAKKAAAEKSVAAKANAKKAPASAAAVAEKPVAAKTSAKKAASGKASGKAKKGDKSKTTKKAKNCLLYTSDAADEL